MKLQEKAEQFAANTQTFLNFISKFQHLIPEEVQDRMTVGLEPEPRLSIQCAYMCEENISATLALIGKVFGATGWLAKLDSSDNTYDWKRTIDGIKITIYSAEKAPPSLEVPVSPNKFPVMLEEVSSLTEDQI